jgi:hypothetical protein
MAGNDGERKAGRFGDTMRFLDRLRASRRLGESYGDVTIRLANGEGAR